MGSFPRANGRFENHSTGRAREKFFAHGKIFPKNVLH
jgi:hypothetical protein